MATAERDAKDDAALEDLLARNPEWLNAYKDKYGKDGMDRLREAFRWGYTVEEHRHWWSHWSVDETTRTISLDADIWWKHSPEFVADKLHAALNSKYVHPPKTEDVYILQPGDIETWDGAGNQHQQFDIARAHAAIVVRQTAQDVTIEVASLGAAGGLTFAVRKLDQASDIVRSISWIESGIERARATGSPALRPLQQALLDLRHRLATLLTAVDDVADNVIGKLDDAPRVNPRSRLPKSYGNWISGTRGNGFWKSDLPQVNAITKNKPIKYVNGRPVFTPWSKGRIPFQPGELDGSEKDFDKVYDFIMKKYKLSSRSAAETYLRNARLTPHHLNNTTIELIPMDLHSNVPHIGSASDLRGGY